MRRPSPNADLCPRALCPTRPHPSMPALICVSLAATNRKPIRSLTPTRLGRFRHVAAVPTRCGGLTKKKQGQGGRARTKSRNKEPRERRHGRESDASERGLGPGLWGVNLRHGTSAALVDMRLLESDCKGSAICATEWDGSVSRERRARERANRANSRSEQRGRSSRAMCSNLLLMEIIPPTPYRVLLTFLTQSRVNGWRTTSALASSRRVSQVLILNRSSKTVYRGDSCTASRPCLAPGCSGLPPLVRHLRRHFPSASASSRHRYRYGFIGLTIGHERSRTAQRRDGQLPAAVGRWAGRAGLGQSEGTRRKDPRKVSRLFRSIPSEED